MINKYLFVVVLLFLLFSCSTTLRIEPTNNTESLIIGQVQLSAKNWPYYGDATVNGTHYSSIELTFKNLTNGEDVIVTSRGQDGFFYFSGSTDSRYQLVKLYFEDKASDGSWANVYTTPNALMFDITSSKVFNLGKLEWETDNKTNKHNVYYGKKYSEVQSSFEEKYIESNWNSFPWENVVYNN